MALTSVPMNIVIVVAEDEETGYTVFNRDSGETLLRKDAAKSARKREANALSKATGWPVVDHA